jgi:hypothetical protein
MSDHRDSEDTTPSHAEPDRFCPSDALESLRAAILRVDTIAQVACYAVDELRYPGHGEAGRAFARMQILVGKAADEASMALAEGDEVMAALTEHLQARGAERDLGEQPDGPARPKLARRHARSSPRARARGARRP